MKEKAKLEEEKKDEEKEDPKGIPEFWLTVFKNVDLLSDMLQVFSLWKKRENRSQRNPDLPPPAGRRLHGQFLNPPFFLLRITMNPYLNIYKILKSNSQIQASPW